MNEEAKVASVRSKLKKQGLLLRSCSESSPDFHTLGRHYVIDERNCVVEKDIDIEELDARLG